MGKRAGIPGQEMEQVLLQQGELKGVWGRWEVHFGSSGVRRVGGLELHTEEQQPWCTEHSKPGPEKKKQTNKKQTQKKLQ